MYNGQVFTTNGIDSEFHVAALNSLFSQKGKAIKVSGDIVNMPYMLCTEQSGVISITAIETPQQPINESSIVKVASSMVWPNDVDMLLMNSDVCFYWYNTHSKVLSSICRPQEVVCFVSFEKLIDYKVIWDRTDIV